MMSIEKAHIVKWVSVNVLPHEGELRGWLRRTCQDSTEVDDLVHDVYCRLLRLSEVSHITDPRAYLFRIARRLMIDRARRSTVVRIEVGYNVEAMVTEAQGPSPEQIVVARAELKWVLSLIGRLPDRCRRVFELRKILGMSQGETASSLFLSENIVEKETARGLTLISAMVASAGGGLSGQQTGHGTSRGTSHGRALNVGN